VLGGHRRDRRRVGCDQLDPDAEPGADGLDDLVGLLGQPPGVQGDYPHGRVEPAGQVDHDHALDLEGGDDDEPVAELTERPGQQLIGRPSLKARGRRDLRQGEPGHQPTARRAP
jgi:hypothetical protein